MKKLTVYSNTLDQLDIIWHACYTFFLRFHAAISFLLTEHLHDACYSKFKNYSFYNVNTIVFRVVHISSSKMKSKSTQGLRTMLPCNKPASVAQTIARHVIETNDHSNHLALFPKYWCISFCNIQFCHFD